MFPRRKRLTRPAFKGVLQGGRRILTPHFTIIIGNHIHGHAVVVSKKVARLSVERHKIKRRVIAVLHTLPLTHSIIFYPKRSLLTLSFKEIQKEIETVLSKIMY